MRGYILRETATVRRLTTSTGWRILMQEAIRAKPFTGAEAIGGAAASDRPGHILYSLNELVGVVNAIADRLVEVEQRLQALEDSWLEEPEPEKLPPLPKGISPIPGHVRLSPPKKLP